MEAILTETPTATPRSGLLAHPVSKVELDSAPECRQWPPAHRFACQYTPPAVCKCCWRLRIWICRVRAAGSPASTMGLEPMVGSPNTAPLDATASWRIGRCPLRTSRDTRRLRPPGHRRP